MSLASGKVKTTTLLAFGAMLTALWIYAIQNPRTSPDLSNTESPTLHMAATTPPSTHQRAYLAVDDASTETAVLGEPDLEPAPFDDLSTDLLALESEMTTEVEISFNPAPSLSGGAAGGGVAALPPALEEERVILPEQIPISAPIDPLSGWDPAEFQSLKSPTTQDDILGHVPDGTVLVPIQPLTPEEVLSTDQSIEPLGYTLPGIGLGNPVPLQPNGILPAAGFLPDDQIHLESAEFLDYDEERHTIYGHGRIVARFGAYKLEADRMMIDTRIRELQAYGNVQLTGPNEYVEAESLHFDTKNGMGTAYNARGRSGFIYFLADPHVNGGRTTFHQLSNKESHFHEGSFTTCDFPVPHYRLQAKEFTIMSGDRIFAKNVVLYIMETPVIWLPYYTMSLKDDNPWAIKLGSDNQLGFYARLAYNFRYSSYTPSDVDDRIMVKRSTSQGRILWDFFSKRGFGKGLEYRYRLNDDQHRGRVFVYQLNDSERDVAEDEPERSYANIFNRTSLGKSCDGADISALLDVDYASDPDIFFDVFDRLRGSSELRRGRLSERHSVFGLERTHDDYFAGVRMELRDRIGRDRFSNFSEPNDDDSDFDRRFNDEQFFTINNPGRGPGGGFFYPDAGTYSDRSQYPTLLDNGVASSRYGRVSARLPQLTISTNRERLWCLPLWYHLDLNVFNNLDSGLNVVGTRDDSFVPGFDLYQSLTHLQRFSERYTLLTKVGLGVGYAQRLDNSFNPDIPEGASFPFVQDGQIIGGRVSGVTFTDADTFLVGTRKMSLRDVDPFFAYGDLDSKFNARITDSMNAFARYRVRMNLGTNLGQFYEQVGRRTAEDDLYAFRTPEHWIEGGITQSLQSPNASITLSAGKNLQGPSDLTADELTHYVNLSGSWHTLRQTLHFNGGLGIQGRQFRDPSDPLGYIADTMTMYVAASYLPIHQRHYARIGAFHVINTTDDPLDLNTDDRGFDSENQTVLNMTVGKKIGTKYLVEYRTSIRAPQETNVGDSGIRIERDFHDAVAGISLGFRGDRLSRTQETASQDNVQLRFNFRLKPAADKGVNPVRSSGDLFSSRKLSAFETGG